MHGSGGQTGNFRMQILYDYQTSRYQGCSGASQVYQGSPNQYSGYTPGQPSYYPEVCGDAGHYTSAGLWYYIVGSGGTITIDTCNLGTNFDTMVRHT